MKINVKQTGDKIIDLVGGVNNISSFTHCLTRLRFYLKDPAKAKTEEIKKYMVFLVHFIKWDNIK